MITFRETRLAEDILPFLAGKGVRRLVAAGVDLSDEEVEKMVKINLADDKNHTFLVKDDSIAVGFISLMFESEGVSSIHTCVRTFGQKTKDIFGMALNLAQRMFNNREVVGVYERRRKSCERLVQAFGFVEDKDRSTPDMCVTRLRFKTE